MTNPRIQIDTANDCTCPNRHPHLDEFVLKDVASVHFEAMGDSQFWIGITANDGRSWMINCGAVNHRARGYAFVEED
jgi:hypothetical protein